MNKASFLNCSLSLWVIIWLVMVVIWYRTLKAVLISSGFIFQRWDNPAKYLSLVSFCICSVHFLSLQLLFDAWGQSQCSQRWLISIKPQIDLTHVRMSNAWCFQTKFSHYLSSEDVDLSERALSFVSERYTAHKTSHIDSRPPQIPTKGGSVSSGGMQSF